MPSIKSIILSVIHNAKTDPDLDEGARDGFFSISHGIDIAVPCLVDIEREETLADAAIEFGKTVMGFDGGFAHDYQWPYESCLFHGKWLNDQRRWEGGNPVLHVYMVPEDLREEAEMTWIATLILTTHNGVNETTFKVCRRLDGSVATSRCGGEITEYDDSLYQWIFLNALSIAALLSMKIVDKSATAPSARINQKRARQGRAPLDRNLFIRLSKPARDALHEAVTHASPRPHFRRGHMRDLGDGRYVPVSPSMVMGDAPLPKKVSIKI